MITRQSIFYHTDDGELSVELRLSDGELWLSQKQIADLFETNVPTACEHIARAIADLRPSARSSATKKFLHVRQEGSRRVSRMIKHYSMPVVLAVAAKARSSRGRLFAKWIRSKTTESGVKTKESA